MSQNSLPVPPEPPAEPPAFLAVPEDLDAIRTAVVWCTANRADRNPRNASVGDIRKALSCGVPRAQRLQPLVRSAPVPEPLPEPPAGPLPVPAEEAPEPPSGTPDPSDVPAEREAEPQPEPSEPTKAERRKAPRSKEWVRLVPPVAALGTAFVLQVIIVTDVLGGALIKEYGGGWGWRIVAMFFGLAVASGLEGAAAYLLDLYEKHLLARDSVAVLRLALVGYVVGSGTLIHWWTEQRNLPTELSWVLAGMAASSIFLWMRGSRWKHRQALRQQGQMDEAMPRLPLAAKMLHPVRWAATMWLVSWDPAGTTAEARARYEARKAERKGRKGAERSAGTPQSETVD